jgi:exonuclease VII small subunit
MPEPILKDLELGGVPVEAEIGQENKKPSVEESAYDNYSSIMTKLENDNSMSREQKVGIIGQVRLDLEDKLEVLSQQAEIDRAKMVEARKAMGIDSGEDAVQDDMRITKIQGQLQALGDLESRIGGQRQETEKGEEEIFLKENIRKMREDVEASIFALKEGILSYERGQALLSLAASQLESAAEGIVIDYGQLESAIASLDEVAKNVNEIDVPMDYQSVESLNRLFYALGGLIDSILKTRSKFAQSTNEKANEISLKIGKLLDSLDNAQLFLNSKSRALSEYLG